MVISSGKYTVFEKINKQTEYLLSAMKTRLFFLGNIFPYIR